MKYVIIGNSAAAVGCIEGIRSIDKEGEITVISDEIYHTYSRPLISYYLSGKTAEDKIYYRDKDFYVNNNCKTLLGKRAIKIDSINKNVVLDDNSKISYDKLLVATGSRPFVPNIEGYDKVTNKFTFLKYDDAKALEKVINPESKVLIIGAGLIGLKCAEGLYDKVGSITVIDLADRVLSSILDVKGSEIMMEHLTKKGINIILSDSIEKFEENKAYTKSSKTIDFDICVMAVGVRPNVELLLDAGAKINKGAVVNDRQETNVQDIYSAGDCCESFDISLGSNRILALLPNAYLQGETAGINMAGGDKEFNKAIPMNAIGLLGLHIITAGSYIGESNAFYDENGYKNLFINQNHLSGYILIGDIKRAGIYTSLIREQVPLSEVDLELLLKAPQLMMFSKEKRAEKLGVKR